jgi:leucyl/phenylalanyl-tRNA--protein transferase
MFFLTPAQVLQGYSMGIFPMADPEDNAIHWYEPEMRGIMPLDQFKVSKSLRKRILNEEFDVTMNKAFSEVIRCCAEREETWISDEIQEVYTELNEMGYAHSIECWKGEELVGGLYGVAIDQAFFGESMFHKSTDASKVALYYLVEWLKANNYQLLDMQYLTPHLESMGGVAISAIEYKKKLHNSIKSIRN